MKKLSDFFNNDFKNFSNQDNIRSIPKLTDGLKDSQRKAVYGMFCNGTKEVKVSQLAEVSSMKTHYEHGAVSLEGTIVGLTQNYPGSNNLNLFEPIGQFGSILSSEAGASRYIYTKPSNNLRNIFIPDDDHILGYKEVDGHQVEPETYFPIVPLWAVNGAKGIGTGHSVNILPRAPEGVVRAIKAIVDGKPVNDEDVMPYYSGWTGSIKRVDNRFEITGRVTKINTTTIRIDEVPAGMGIDKLKDNLVTLMDSGKIKDFDNNSSDEGFNVVVYVPREVGKLSEDKLISLFKLTSRVTENITLWNADNVLTKYDTIVDALKEFVSFRFDAITTRKDKLLDIAKDEYDWLLNKKRFIECWIKHPSPSKTKMGDIVQYMIDNNVKEEYLDKLLSLRISILTSDNIEEIDKDIANKDKMITKLDNTTERKMYFDSLSKI